MDTIFVPPQGLGQIHHVAVHTMRPELLFQQIAAFRENYVRFARARGTRVRFYIFIDDPRRDEEFCLVAERISKLLAGQMEFTLRLFPRSMFAARLPHSERFFFDLSLGRLGGIRCIQNISEYILSADEISPGDIVHRIDDDVYPLDLRFSEDALIIEHANDFFGERESLLQRSDVKLLGSALASDSPSPVGDLYWSLKTTARFFEVYSGHSASDMWTDVARAICPSAADRVNDPDCLLDTIVLPIHASFGDVAERLADLLGNLEKGRGRIVLAPSSFYRSDRWWINGPWIGPRYYTPNACVCHRAGDVLAPAFPHGNPDIVTYACESIWYQGGVWGAPPVLHLKASSRRGSLFDAAAVEQKHDYARTKAALWYLGETELTSELERKMLLHVISYAQRQLSEIGKFCKSILGYIQEDARTSAASADRIRDIVQEAERFTNLLSVSLDAPVDRECAKHMMKEYRVYSDDWKQAVTRIVRTNVKGIS
jgi:hypothetical protein